MNRDEILMFFTILKSHSKLSQAEYNRNSSYNNSHFSAITEYKALDFLRSKNLLDEFIDFMRNKKEE